MQKTQKKTGKISRRQLVTLLGSSVAFAGTVRAEDLATVPASCTAVTPQTSKGADGRLLLIADPCCLDGFEVFEAGLGGQGASYRAKGNFRDFRSALKQAKKDDVLLEYCVMIWGLSLEERAKTVADLKDRYFPKGK